VTRADTLRRYILRSFYLEAERVAIERERRVDVLHSDSDVIENRLHTPSA
jgi:hypothetical protein